MDLDGDGAAGYKCADADGTCGTVAGENADASSGSRARARESAGDVGAPMVSGRPSPEVVDAVGEEVELMCRDDRGGGVAMEGLETGRGGAIVADDFEARKRAERWRAWRGLCP